MKKSIVTAAVIIGCLALVISLPDKSTVKIEKFKWVQSSQKIEVEALLMNRKKWRQEGLLRVTVESVSKRKDGPRAYKVGVQEFPFTLGADEEKVVNGNVDFKVAPKGELIVSKILIVQPVAGGDATR